ncbi:NADH-quinone oxidoreductase subunit M [Streptomyces sp. P01-B04]|uniref:NADH-quinone oxidoreductase subunit M n=1 Tax=Streptomyces poriferorum TaxID=2798799 RepID=A0ABY9J291_9ACTN|nr:MULTISPECIES: NADH-quinone oxidoreductase subunit M [Streptomyces]MBW5248702.1 NADH-quinone oxidoreductase subunit M [Streptomyces poriferorum]MBW5257130.1 NADH-quinone oxidoreductase subunit M [Streptomyces poriferorum]MDP5314003.1 NADH-quinone oxidoreductase subunit M [Streptomyces sp. Alt4]WLQ61710.1 NADH-quinone oxidoreductase subunit M [Streptomyces sp. Alt2]WSI68374.1 NADH-quinone oxidoreductase subunit M [Streptomyces sp. NBC_01336]
MQFLLAFIVVVPLLGAVAALLPAPPGLKGRNPDQAVLRHGVTVTGVILIAAIVLALGFDHDHPSKMQATTDISWIPALDVRIHLGIDGISLPLLVLTALLTFLCALYSYFKLQHERLTPRAAGPSPKAFVALILVLESGTLATFAVLDLLLFFLAFEMVLIPMYFLIARWGGAQKQAAAWKFILYTLLGSVVMLLGLLLIGLKSGTFDMVALATDNGRGLTSSVQVIAVLAIGIGLAVKTPMWPLHSWLPDAHTAAPTVGSVLLAGVMLKMGTYGFVRILLPIAPDGMHTFAPYLAAFAVAGIIYGSLACLALARPGAKGDLKRLIAYSSVGHMGFVLLGIASMTPTGVNGALFANIAHGLITGLLFFLVGAVKDRYGTADLDTLAGATGAALYGRAPRLGGLLAFAAVASLGLPGLAGFWGEMLALFGAFDPAEGLNRAAFLTFMSIAAFGTLLTAAYLLIVVRRVCMGAKREEPHPIADVQSYEFAAWTPLAALTVLAGLWPAVLLGLTDPAVQKLLAGGKS